MPSIHDKQRAVYMLRLSAECKKNDITQEVFILSNPAIVLTFPKGDFFF